MPPTDPIDDAYALGAAYEATIETHARRTRGAHFTPRALCLRVLSRALGPCARPDRAPLRVCDPSCGPGNFLLAALETLAPTRATDSIELRFAARRRALDGLYGVDLDPGAVAVARRALALACGDPSLEHDRDLCERICIGDALTGSPFAHPASRAPAPPGGLDFEAHFREVFSRENPGFDALVGNPPWVAYAGRAAQPLEPARRRFFESQYESFHGYRTLHAIFAERAARLLRAGGRLGLLLPTSIVDLSGYGPSRHAVSALCELDTPLDDLGDGRFAGVFQPCASITGTRRAGPHGGAEAPWVLSRDDLDATERSLLERLETAPKFSRDFFGERGVQTTNAAHSLCYASGATGRFTVPLREGADLRPFELFAPRAWLDPSRERAPLRSAEAYRACTVLVRQTARYPIAARSDGSAFRNSILAGFPREPWSPEALVAWLNSAPVRWFHYARNRDARQGMPQVKVAHLRALPALDATDREHARRVLAALDALGRVLSARNTGATDDEQRALDALVCDALALTDDERRRVAQWASRICVPVASSRA